MASKTNWAAGQSKQNLCRRRHSVPSSLDRRDEHDKPTIAHTNARRGRRHPRGCSTPRGYNTPKSGRRLFCVFSSKAQPTIARTHAQPTSQLFGVFFSFHHGTATWIHGLEPGSPASSRELRDAPLFSVAYATYVARTLWRHALGSLPISQGTSLKV